MKTNLIKKHITYLKDKEVNWIPYGGSNPYHYCSECAASNVEGGHRKECFFSTRDALLKQLEAAVESISQS